MSASEWVVDGKEPETVEPKWHWDELDVVDVEEIGKREPNPGNWEFDKVMRSRAPHGARKAVAHGPIVLFVAYVIWTQLGWATAQTAFMIAFFSAMGLLVTGYLIAGVYWRTFTHLPPATGRVLAIVPVYNEEDRLAHATVQALLDQTVLPDAIHVVDDGSLVPLSTFDHPLVTWHRIKNSGKREAQGHVLSQYTAKDFEFVLTVDSDSVLDHDALERLLESMSDDRVMAATGMIFTRNWDTNILTRMTDMNVTISCLLLRMLRSWFGIVSPTSGALALYRSHVIFDNLNNYLYQSGTAGDDRRLSFYALLKGQVVGVSEAVVSTQLPTSVKGAFWQRTRWSKSAWLGTPFVLSNLRPLMVFFYIFPLAFALMFPFAVGVLAITSLRYHNIVILYGVLFWVVVSVTQAMVYLLYRPGMAGKDKWIQLAVSFVYPLFGLVILRPAAYYALTQLKSTSWHTRETKHIPRRALVETDA